MRCVRLDDSDSDPDPVADSRWRRSAWIAVLLIPAFVPTGRPAWAWDVAPNDFMVLDPAATVATATAAAAAGKLNFDQGTPLRLGCYYQYQSGVDVPPPWRVEFSVDGQPVGSVPGHAPQIATITNTEESVSLDPSEPGIQSETSTSLKLVAKTYYAEVKWTAAGDGARNVQCRLNPDKVPGESNVHNNTAQQTIIVKRFQALTGGDLPPVALVNMAGSGALLLGPSLQVPFNATVSAQPVDGKANVIEYAKASPFEETWHIEILRKGDGGTRVLESPLGEFQGPLQSLQFSASLNHAWSQAHGMTAGRYTARAYVAQTVSGQTTAGPQSSVEFEIHEPQQADTSLQPAGGATVAPGSPVIVPSPSPDRAPPAPEVVGRTATSEGRQVAPIVRASAPAQLMEVEAEALAKMGTIEVTGGQAGAQQMTGFGGDWSGDEQLFWRGGEVGAVLDLIVNVPVASKYAVEIYLTRAPDYAQLRFEVDGNASAVVLDAMAPQVMVGGPTQLGTFPLEAGQRRISLMITGKHAQSTNYYVGIDKLRLYPAGPID